MSWAFDNSYARLPERFFARRAPEPAPAPKHVVVNTDLAAELGLSTTEITPEIATGSALPPGAEPLAQVYAGHQFGNFVPQLGDGRAHLLGELCYAGQRRDLALKGSGRTPFSRGGDGRAWLGPVIREYLMSESLHALGIRTTRALAVTQTGATVLRQEGPLPGAVLMRVARSHLRVGTFQYFAARGDIEALRLLSDYAAERHYPQAGTLSELLFGVTQAQAELVAAWMAVGFIHGVMNTDNCSICGETIDYGPCAFMEDTDLDRVFSSIDHRGRYAYSNQAAAAHWNLAQFASCLVPLETDQDLAIEEFTEIINRFPQIYSEALQNAYRSKLGLRKPEPDLIQELLEHFQKTGQDYSLGFAALQSGTDLPSGWRQRWAGLRDPEIDISLTNPITLPRLHLIDNATRALMLGEQAPFDQLLKAIQSPYSTPDDPALSSPATPENRVTRTYCGT